jgi:hypothetical protein
MLIVIMFSVVMHIVVTLSSVVMSATMLTAIMLCHCVTWPNVIQMNVVAPTHYHKNAKNYKSYHYSKWHCLSLIAGLRVLHHFVTQHYTEQTYVNL